MLVYSYGPNFEKAGDYIHNSQQQSYLAFFETFGAVGLFLVSIGQNQHHREGLDPVH